MDNKESYRTRSHCRPKVIIISCLLFLLQVSNAPACLWDGDTLAAENARFPKVLDLITGNFPRHSSEFHQWRIAETRKRIEKTPTLLAFYDDLAVSQHKLGDHAGAIETMRAKQKLQPGVYETYSNMGTFLIYTGELPKALEFINKALSINPNAHFGREKYQKWLVEWVIAGKPIGTDPLDLDRNGTKPWGFAAFVLSKQGPANRDAMTEALRRDAMRGVLGMMRFADFDNPILQEALGDLLSFGKPEANATHLACLAYLHASRKADSPIEKARLTQKIEMATLTLANSKEEDRERELNEGLAKGENLAKQVREDEIEWISNGKNASDEFIKKYFPAEVPAEKAAPNPAN